MLSVFHFAIQERSRGTIGEIAYSLGYFVGSNFWEVVIIAVTLLLAILYFAFFGNSRRKLD